MLSNKFKAIPIILGRRLLHISVRVKPGSKSSSILEAKLDEKDTQRLQMTVKLKEEAMDNKANEALREMLAYEVFHIALSDVEIVKGLKSRDKVVRVSSLEVAEAIQMLQDLKIDI